MKNRTLLNEANSSVDAIENLVKYIEELEGKVEELEYQEKTLVNTCNRMVGDIKQLYIELDESKNKQQ